MALPPAIRQLLGSERGKRFLLNLYWSLQEKVPVDLARELLNALPNGAVARRSFDPSLERLRGVIFGDAGKFQFLGDPAAGSGLWMTVKSAADLRGVILAELGAEAFNARFEGRFSTAKPTAQTYEAIEEIINDQSQPVRFLMNKSSRQTANDDARRAFPGWFSRWCKFTENFGSIELPSREGAKRLRDWLGLTHYGPNAPLFVLRLRTMQQAASINGRRPTICDGFDNPVFKYPVTEPYVQELCGSAADLEVLSHWQEGPIDGGPEVISPEAWFDTRTHECRFAGFAGDHTYDFEREDFHRHLLKETMRIETVAEEVARQLGMVH